MAGWQVTAFNYKIPYIIVHCSLAVVHFGTYVGKSNALLRDVNEKGKTKDDVNYNCFFENCSL